MATARQRSVRVCGSRTTYLVVGVGVGDVDERDAQPGPQRRGEQVERRREAPHVQRGLRVEELQTCSSRQHDQPVDAKRGTADSVCGAGPDEHVWTVGVIVPVTEARISETPTSRNCGTCHSTLTGDTYDNIITMTCTRG